MIIVRLSGGMGNQMFQYALGRRLALQYDVPLMLDTTFLLHRVTFPRLLRPHFVFRNYDLDVFAIHAAMAEPEDMKWWQRPLFSGKLMLFADAMLRKLPLLRGWEKSFAFDERVLSLGPNAYVAGFWQSPKYFDAIRETLIADFVLREPLPEATQALYGEIKDTVSLCVNVRREDFASSSFHGALEHGYYHAALEKMLSLRSIEKIYVFSDDIAWCQAHLRFSLPTVYVGHEHKGKKFEAYLCLMAACRHFIIPNSTFAWWAAWLSNNSDKVVIAPAHWFKNDAIDASDLIPKEWITM